MSKSSFDTSSTLLIDFSTRVVWSKCDPNLSPTSGQAPGLLATLSPSPEGEDLSFCFRLTDRILDRFLTDNRGSKEFSNPKSNGLLKKFRCPQCKFSCVNSAQLAGHVRKHTGERPFQCPEKECAKKFARKEELTRHIRIHTGHRPYQCCICEKRFGRKDHLNKHMNVHVTRYADPFLQKTVCKFFAHLTYQNPCNDENKC